MQFSSLILIFSDDVYLLQFLRYRNYNMIAAVETLETSYIARLQYSETFDFTEKKTRKVMELIKTGVFYQLSERDELGRNVVLMQIARFDPDIFAHHDIMRMVNFVTAVLLETELNQVTGFVIIVNTVGITWKHLITPIEVRDSIGFVSACIPVKQKRAFVMNLPSFASFITDLFKLALSQKITRRLFIVKNIEELATHFDLSMLPQHLGGTRSENKMMQDFLKLCEDRKEVVLKGLNFKIDCTKVPNGKTFIEKENVGSFRRLEID